MRVIPVEPQKAATRRPLCALLLVAAVVAAPSSHAQIDNLRLPISLDADSTDYDGKNSMLLFEGLRLTQGNIGVQADRGLASKLDFEDSVWQFSGNVVIDTENGRIECETADLKFSSHQLALASISGSPATFELQRIGSEETTYAEAGQLDYDFAEGVIEFSGNAVITEGGNQISSNHLVYNIKEQRINAQSAGEGEPRVKITYTPRVTDETLTPNPDAAGGEPAEPTEPAELTPDDPPLEDDPPRDPGGGAE